MPKCSRPGRPNAAAQAAQMQQASPPRCSHPANRTEPCSPAQANAGRRQPKARRSGAEDLTVWRSDPLAERPAGGALRWRSASLAERSACGSHRARPNAATQPTQMHPPSLPRCSTPARPTAARQAAQMQTNCLPKCSLPGRPMQSQSPPKCSYQPKCARPASPNAAAQPAQMQPPSQLKCNRPGR